jgi:protoheme IX farnesyltransferase
VATPVAASDLAARTDRTFAVLAAYVKLTKPRIIELLLITTVPAMFLAASGVPKLSLVVTTLIGGTAAAGGANAINQYLDRDIDQLMRRTKHRPLPEHTIPPTNALVFGLALAVGSFAFLALTTGLLAAWLTLSAVAFYAVIYTMWLKRRTVQNIVVGGAAGAVPVLVGWAAVTGRVGVPALGLFAIVFLWTPPHFWALSLVYREDYAAAGVPMLPVVVGVDRTVRQMWWYAVVLVAATLHFVPIGRMGLTYDAAAAGLGAWFLLSIWKLRRAVSHRRAMQVFRVSIGYLTLLFAAVALDAFLRRAV